VRLTSVTVPRITTAITTTNDKNSAAFKNIIFSPAYNTGRTTQACPYRLRIPDGHIARPAPLAFANLDVAGYSDSQIQAANA